MAAAQTNSFLPPSEHSLLLSRHRAMNDKRGREQGRGGGRSRELISSNFGGEGIKQKVGNEGGRHIFSGGSSFVSPQMRTKTGIPLSLPPPAQRG